MYVVTGATGHTGNVVARTLLTKGEKVRAISRTPSHLKDLAAQGAEPFSADVTDAAALIRAFAGAKAVYVLIPPNPASSDVPAFQKRVSDALAQALQRSRVPYAVVLSSIGADKPDKTGPVLGLRYLEQQLDQIEGLNVLHLRAGYFMENTFTQVGMIRNMGMAAGPLRPDLKLPLIASQDIGEVAAKALLSLDFHKQQTRELHGQRDLDMSEVAQIIGKAISKADLRYTQAPDDQVRNGMMQFGLSGNMADLILQMAAALNSGYMRPLEPRSPQNTTHTTYEAFVQHELVPLYQGKSAAA